MSAMFQGAFRKKNIHRMKTWCPEFGEFEVGHILIKYQIWQMDANICKWNDGKDDDFI